ncbi:hypothetical protein D3C72_1694570 [compost metagenome]
MAIRIIPAIKVHSSNPPTPNCWVMGSSITTKAAVGPDTLKREPPVSAISGAATSAVYRPCCGATPTAMASAIARGMAMMPTVSPAARSPRSAARV